MSNPTDEATSQIIKQAAYPLPGQLVLSEETNDEGKVEEVDVQMPPNQGLTKLELVALKMLEVHLTVSEDSISDLNGAFFDLLMRKAALFLVTAHTYKS